MNFEKSRVRLQQKTNRLPNYLLEFCFIINFLITSELLAN